MNKPWLTIILCLLAGCDEKKSDPVPAASATAAKPSVIAPTSPASAPPAAASVSAAPAASSSPEDSTALDGATILARMGAAVCRALEKCEPATVKSMGGPDKCAKAMSTSPPPGFDKKKATCKASELAACLKVYERDNVCEALKDSKKKTADPKECAICGIK